VTYSIIGILASLILLINNRDILWNGADLTKTQRKYRVFLMGVMAYYITDLLWGILDNHGLTGILYADTVVHFAAMVAAVMLWTQYVISYLEGGSRFEKMLYYIGRAFFAFEIIVILVNFFYPILFSFDETGAYHAGIARYITLAVQILMFLLTSVYTLRVAVKSEGTVKMRHMTISNMSHDIRTPLNAITGYTTLAKQEGIGAEAQREYILKIDKAGSQLLELVNDVLEMSRIESGKLELAPTPIDLEECVRDAGDLVRTQLSLKQIAFTVSCDVTHKWVLCDRNLLNRALMNLLCNAESSRTRTAAVPCRWRRSPRRGSGAGTRSA
jgi:signal transduction histidine kinase